MSHLPIWYLGQLDLDQCDRVVSELSQIERRDAAMGANGEQHNLAVDSAGKIIAWGQAEFGATSVPASLGRILGLAAGQRPAAKRARRRPPPRPRGLHP